MATQTIQVQGGAPIVIPQQQQPPQNLSTIKGLAITQLVIGILTGILGIAVIGALNARTWTTSTGAGIWAGGWITITGIIGVCSVRNTSNNLNGVYMAFSIISTCVAGLAGLFFILAVTFYSILTRCYSDYYWCDYRFKAAGLGLHVPLLLLMIVEFFISIIAAVYSCQRGCAGGQGTGVIIQQAPAVHVVTTGPAPGYQYQMAPQYTQYNQAPPYSSVAPNSTVQMPPQGYQQPMFVQAQYPMQTNVTYSDKPPEYNAAPPQ